MPHQTSEDKEVRCTSWRTSVHPSITIVRGGTSPAWGGGGAVRQILCPRATAVSRPPSDIFAAWVPGCCCAASSHTRPPRFPAVSPVQAARVRCSGWVGGGRAAGGGARGAAPGGEAHLWRERIWRENLARADGRLERGERLGATHDSAKGSGGRDSGGETHGGDSTRAGEA